MIFPRRSLYAGNHREWHRGGDLYDLSVGPKSHTIGPCPRSEWDDPTWIPVEADEEWMAEQDAAVARREGKERLRAERRAAAQRDRDE